MRIPNTVDEPSRWLTSFLVLVFPTVVLFVNHGDSITLGLLGLIGLWAWIRGGAQSRLSRETCLLWLIFAVFFTVVLLSYLFGLKTEDGFHYLGRYLRFLFVVPVYLAFRRFPPTAKTAFIGLALGALLAGSGALLELLRAREPIRVSAGTDLSIIFGDLTSTMVLCAVAGFGLMAATRRAWSVPFLVLCLAGGVVATLLSGTRGAWLPLFLLIPWLATPFSGFLRRRHLLAIVVVIVTVFSSFYFIVGTDTQGRIKLAFSDIKDYFIAVRASDSYTSGQLIKPHCLDRKAFLHAWVHFYTPSGPSPTLAHVVTDPLVQSARGCSQHYVVRLDNSSTSKWARYILPRLPLNRSRSQNTTVLVRGHGTFTIGHAAADQVNFNAQNYRRLLFNATAVPNELIVYVAPASSVWLVPIESYYGEYSLSIAVTSVGKRFDMWRAAWMLFLERPLMGVGTGAYQQYTDELIRQGRVAPFIGTYDHPHNDYLDALASRGILGLFTLLALFLIPVRYFLRATANEDRTLHALGLAGILTVGGFAIYGLTDTIFLHSIMISWYVIYMALFYALIETRTEKINLLSNGNERPIPTPSS